MANQCRNCRWSKETGVLNHSTLCSIVVPYWVKGASLNDREVIALGGERCEAWEQKLPEVRKA